MKFLPLFFMFGFFAYPLMAMQSDETKSNKIREITKSFFALNISKTAVTLDKRIFRFEVSFKKEVQSDLFVSPREYLNINTVFNIDNFKEGVRYIQTTGYLSLSDIGPDPIYYIDLERRNTSKFLELYILFDDYDLYNIIKNYSCLLNFTSDIQTFYFDLDVFKKPETLKILNSVLRKYEIDIHEFHNINSPPSP